MKFPPNNAGDDFTIARMVLSAALMICSVRIVILFQVFELAVRILLVGVGPCGMRNTKCMKLLHWDEQILFYGPSPC